MVTGIDEAVVNVVPERSLIDARRGPVSPRRVLAVTSVGVIAGMLDATIVNVGVSSIHKSFHGSSLAEISWVLSGYNLCFAAFVIPGGRLADRLGRRRVFSWALVCFTSASALCAVAPSLGILIAARCVQGTGEAMLVPAARAMVLQAYPRQRQAIALALWTAIGAAAAAAGPIVGAALISISSWRLIFVANLPVGLFGIVRARRDLVESRSAGQHHGLDLRGAFIIVLAAAALVLGIIQAPTWGWYSLPTLAAFAVAVASAVLFVMHCGRHHDPLVDLGLLRIRAFSLYNASTFTSSTGFYGSLLGGVLFLQGVWHYPILRVGLALTPAPVLAIAVAPWSTRLADRIGLRVVIAAGMLCWAGSAAWLLAHASYEPDFVGVWLPSVVLFGAGAGLATPNLGSASALAAPGNHYGSVAGLNTVVRQLAAALGVALTVTILGKPTARTAVAAFDRNWRFVIVCYAVSLIGIAVVGRFRAPGIQESAPARHPADQLPGYAGAPSGRQSTGLASGVAASAPSAFETTDSST